MSNKKITCDFCGLDFYSHTIIYHEERAYCYMCDFQYMIEQMAEKKTIQMPSYFLNRSHYLNYQYLFTQVYSKVADPFDYVLAAYINGIPSIFNIYPKEYSIFAEIPFIWQFNWQVFQFIKKNDEFYRITLNSNAVLPDKNIYVRRLEKDYQLILESGHFLMSWDEQLRILGFQSIEEYREYISEQLSAAGIKIMNEIFNFFCKGAH